MLVQGIKQDSGVRSEAETSYPKNMQHKNTTNTTKPKRVTGKTTAARWPTCGEKRRPHRKG